MDARARTWILLAITVPLSSLLGLLRAMLRMDASIFASVWKANLWGDIVFVAGTLAAGQVVAAGARRWVPRWGLRGLGLSTACALLLTWATYALAWSCTALSFDDHTAHPFAAFAFQWSAGAGNAAIFTWQWGWPGILAMALLSPALALWTQRGAVLGIRGSLDPGALRDGDVQESGPEGSA